MRLDPAIVEHEIQTLAAVYPELAADDEGWSISLESETSLDEMLVALVRQISDSTTMIDGTKERLAELAARRDRFCRRVEACRRLLLRLMTVANIQKRILPEATLSVREGQPHVTILDEAAIPHSLCEMVRRPNLKAIKAALLADEPVAGAVITPGSPSLTIRVK